MQKAVHSDYHRTEETIKEKIKISVAGCYTFLSKNLRTHHICQHITPSMVSILKCHEFVRESYKEKYELFA
jgi:hypothetical protein